MTNAQELWWIQARSDHELFAKLRRDRAAECHLLHYLQMSTEKLTKAYLWRSGKPPLKSHIGFVRFLKALVVRRGELDRIAAVLGFRRPVDLDNWVKSTLPLADSLQKIAPAQSGNGPNAEYPWPHESPIDCPIGHSFQLWSQLSNTGQGRKLMAFVKRAIDSFDEYA